MSAFDDYLATVSQPERAELERVRQFVRRLVPEAQEGKSYGIPAFICKGRPLLGFQAAKKHLSLFPFGRAPVNHVREDLPGFSLSSGTIRFTPERPLPDSVLEKLVRFKQRQIDAK